MRTATEEAQVESLLRAILKREEPDTFVALFEASSLDRALLAQRGVPAQDIWALLSPMGMPQERLYQTLGIPKATMNRKIKEKKRLDTSESERALGLPLLVGQAASLVKESGNPEGFDAATWTARWVDIPQPSLGGRRPSELMNTAEGRAMVSDLLARLQSGAYG